MKQILAATILISTFGACSNKEEDKIATLESEVLTIHDEVMPKMDSIMLLKSRLAKKIQDIDSLSNVGVSSNTMAEQRIKAVDLNQRLNESDKLMMDWMHGYKGDSAKKLKPDQAVQYFEKEREKILHVQQLTNRSIQEAGTFLQ
jgi:hypothetical protein